MLKNIFHVRFLAEILWNWGNFLFMDLRRLLTYLFLLFTITGFSQKLFESTINVRAGNGTDKREAIIYLPAHYSSSKAYPLVIFAHGMGEAGTNIKKLYKQGLPKVLKKGYHPPFDFIMVAVQRNSFSIMPEWLPGILNDCQKRWKIDASRIYLTGLSAGGWSAYGSQLNISPTFAKKFAAIVINSGATQNADSKNLDWWKESKTPLWAIVGSKDKGFLAQNTKMVNAINQRVPGLATLTVRPGVGHGGWTEIYNGKFTRNGKNMWQWLYQFKRSSTGSTKPPVEEIPLPPAKNDSAVVSKPTATQYIKVNLYSGAAPYQNYGWNNWNVGSTASSNITTPVFKYANGTSTTIRATLSSSLGVVDNGADYASKATMAPAAVLRYASCTLGARTLTFSGLSTTKTYSIYLFSSRRDRPGYITIFKIKQETYSVATNNNYSNKASFVNLHADANGQIQIHIETGNRYNYLNGFMIVESAGPSGK